MRSLKLPYSMPTFRQLSWSLQQPRTFCAQVWLQQRGFSRCWCFTSLFCESARALHTVAVAGFRQGFYTSPIRRKGVVRWNLTACKFVQPPRTLNPICNPQSRNPATRDPLSATSFKPQTLNLEHRNPKPSAPEPPNPETFNP